MGQAEERGREVEGKKFIRIIKHAVIQIFGLYLMISIIKFYQ